MAKSGWRFEWKGAAVLGNVARATVLGVDDTLEAAARGMRADAPVGEEGLLGPSIAVQSKTARGGRVGAAGLPDGRALFTEVGTSKMSPRPWLRRNGDKHFPKLSRKIKTNLKT